MSINIGVRLQHPEAIATKIRYARIDNTNVPNWIYKPNVSITPNTVMPITIAENVDNGQYQIELTPVYSDSRSCNPTIRHTDGCPGLISINAYIQSGNLIVEYIAPSGIPKVLIRVDSPNGGSTNYSYVNNGVPISIPLPANVNGDYFIYGQSVCDETTGFYSARSNQISVTKNSDPTITQTAQSDTGVGGTRTQTFTIGQTVSVGNRYVLTVYSHNVSVVANSGDTAGTIAVKLRDAINATTEGQWNDAGSAPSTGTPGFKPVASASGSQVTIVLNYTNQFVANAYLS